MKSKNFFTAMCGVFVLAGAAFATYTAVTKSQKEMSDLTKQNLEALVQSTKEGNDAYAGYEMKRVTQRREYVGNIEVGMSIEGATVTLVDVELKYYEVEISCCIGTWKWWMECPFALQHKDC